MRHQILLIVSHACFFNYCAFSIETINYVNKVYITFTSDYLADQNGNDYDIVFPKY